MDDLVETVIGDRPIIVSAEEQARKEDELMWENLMDAVRNPTGDRVGMSQRDTYEGGQAYVDVGAATNLAELGTSFDICDNYTQAYVSICLPSPRILF